MFVNKGEGDIPKKINLLGEPTIKEGHVNVGDEEFIILPKDCWYFSGQLRTPIDLPRNYFEVISCSMSLCKIHHYVLPAVIQTMNQLLVNSGIVIVSVPNFSYYALEHPEEEEINMDMIERIQTASVKLLDPIVDTSHKYKQNKSLWTPTFAEYLFTRSGFEIYEMSDNEPVLWFKAILKEHI